ncbi:MAG TPA: hypothetical protein VJV78_30930 [Polyangiales bacterium]|nr:hypothetical protein [Polyangiales bacterium]
MRVESIVAVLLLLSACESASLVLGDGNGSGNSGAGRSGEADARVEVPPEPDPKDAPAPMFGEPRLIAEISYSDKPDDDPSLSADRLLLCFNSKREGGEGKEDVWCATRQHADARWDAPQPLQELNSDVRETGIALAPDGLSLWFSSDRDGGSGGLDVYLSRRESSSAAWSAPVRVPELSSARDDLVSSIDESGRRLVLARRDDDDDDYDVFVSLRDGPDHAWQTPQALSEINTDDEESDGFLVGAGLSLIFTRDKDLMLARRASTSQLFDSGRPIDTLNSAEDDRDAWADPELRYIVFSSDRDGDYRLYEARR